MLLIVSIVTLVVVIVNFYLLNEITHKIYLLWLNESSINKAMNAKILEDINRKK